MMPEESTTAEEVKELKAELQNIKSLITNLQESNSSEIPDRITYSMDRKLLTGQFENVGIFFSISSSVPPTCGRREYGKLIALAVESIIHEKESELNESFGLKRKTVYELMRDVRKNKRKKKPRVKNKEQNGITLLEDITGDDTLEKD